MNERIEAERKRFEQWARKTGYSIQRSGVLGLPCYDNSYTEVRWQAWLSALGLEEQMSEVPYKPEPTKTKGILWKLSPEEKQALREVCDYARGFAADFGTRTAINHIESKIRELLGEGGIMDIATFILAIAMVESDKANRARMLLLGCRARKL